MTEEQLVTYITGYCRHELSHAELLELKGWLEENAEHRQEFDHLMAKYKTARRVGCWDAIQEEKAWNNITQQLLTTRKTRIIRWWRYAAVILILIGLGTVYYTLHNDTACDDTYAMQFAPGSRKAILRLSNGQEVNLTADTNCVLTEKNGARITVGGQEHIIYDAEGSNREELVYNTIIVPRGGEYSLVLADGSRVWLNSETELTYPAVFSKQERHLILKGEAFFEVAQDTSRPFIVESRHNRVEVLGTRFNVSAYDDLSPVKTTLLQGCVKITNGHDHLLLRPGEQAVCSENGLESHPVDAKMIASWVYGTFEFENMTLAEITDQLGRWYDVDFLYENLALKAITFTGAATRYKDLGFMLSMLEQLSGVRFIVTGKTIRVVEK